ncbi:MAG: hypothetical protein V1689_12675, partial [Pseudomonadota bacterium]
SGPTLYHRQLKLTRQSPNIHESPIPAIAITLDMEGGFIKKWQKKGSCVAASQDLRLWQDRSFAPYPILTVS